MKKTALALMLIFSIMVVAVIVFAQLVTTQVFCVAYEIGTSDWEIKGGFPALTSYSYGDKNWSTSQVKLGVSIVNNNSMSLFNVGLEVKYRTAEGDWKTVTKTNLGSLDAQEITHTEIILTNPHLSPMDVRRPNSARYPTVWENVTVYVLNTIDDVKITAYGFARP
jgi:hypothetical protein